MSNRLTPTTPASVRDPKPPTPNRPITPTKVPAAESGHIRRNSKGSNSAAKLDTSQTEVGSGLTDSKVQPRKPPKPSAHPPPVQKKHSFSEIYKNYVKPPQERGGLNLQLLQPLLMGAHDSIGPAGGMTDRLMSFPSYNTRRDPKVELKTNSSQTPTSFLNFPEYKAKFGQLINNDLIDHDWDDVDLFEFIICMKDVMAAKRG